MTFSNGTALEFHDLKLFRKGRAGIALSEKQVKDQSLPGLWVKVEPLIPDRAYEPLRTALLERYERETSDQLTLF